MSHEGNDYLIDIARDEEEDTRTIDLTPDARGLLRWIRHVAESDRTMAMRLLISCTKEGWGLSDEQLGEILDGSVECTITNSNEVTG